MKKRLGNNNLSIGKLLDLIEEIDSKNEQRLSEIKLEIQKTRTELLDRISESRERLTRLESRPTSEEFQSRFCPNTKEIELINISGGRFVREFISSHLALHNELTQQLKDIKTCLETAKKNAEKEIETISVIYENKLEERDARSRKAMYAAIAAFLAIAVPLMIETTLRLMGR